MNQLIYAVYTLFFAVFLIGCDIEHQVHYRYRQCDVTSVEEGIRIQCGQSVQYIYNGDDGADGSNGTDGILAVYDPCGDGPGHDELILKLNSGQFVAWYKNVGIVELKQDTVYRTTDDQKCTFKIVGDVITELP